MFKPYRSQFYNFLVQTFESSDPDPNDYLEQEHSTWGNG